MRFAGFLIVLGASIQLAAANLALWTIPEIPGVTTEAVGELMNTTDFTTINTAEWVVFLDQPAEVLEGWDATKKHCMFSLLHDALISGGGLQKRLVDTTEAQANEHVRSLEARYLTQVVRDEENEKEEKGCIHKTACVLCVTAAATAATVLIATCASTAFTSIHGVTPAAGPAAAVFYTPIVLQLIAYASKPTAAALGASSGCVNKFG